jgi:hypothetical protein
MAYSSFISRFKEAARVNRFMIIGIPFLGDGVQVKATSIPGHTIGVCEVWHEGRSLKLPGDRTTETWDVTFYVDGNALIYQALKKFHNDVLDIGKGNSGSNDDNTLTVTMMDRKGIPIPLTTTLLKGAWISGLSAIDLDMSSNDTPAEVTATITYNYIDTI